MLGTRRHMSRGQHLLHQDLFSVFCQTRVCQVRHHQLTPFFVYGQLQPGPGLSSERPVAVHTLSLSRPLEQKLVAQKRTNMEMAKRLRQKLHSFLLTVKRSFSALGISNLFKKPIFYMAFRSILHPVCGCHGAFPSVGS